METKNFSEIVATADNGINAWLNGEMSMADVKKSYMNAIAAMDAKKERYMTILNGIMTHTEKDESNDATVVQVEFKAKKRGRPVGSKNKDVTVRHSTVTEPGSYVRHKSTTRASFKKSKTDRLPKGYWKDFAMTKYMSGYPTIIKDNELTASMMDEFWGERMIHVHTNHPDYQHVGFWMTNPQYKFPNRKLTIDHRRSIAQHVAAYIYGETIPDVSTSVDKTRGKNAI